MKYINRFVQQAQNGDCGSTAVKATPDGGFLYITMHSVTFVKIEPEKPLVKNYCTKQPIVEIDIDPGWSDQEKLFATLTVSNSVLIWDLDKNIAISGHKAHCPLKPFEGRNGRYGVARISFMKNRNLMSISAGELVVYCIASNSTLVRSNFLNQKSPITVLKCSPYDEHIFACGTNKGTVFVCDLQKSCTLYSFDGHESSVVFLSWNAVDLSVTEKKLVKCAAVSSPPDMPCDGDDIFNIYDYDYLENEFGAPVKNSNDDGNEDYEIDTAANELSIDPNFNFSEACESLKQEINALNENTTIEETDACDAVTLADCQEIKNLACASSAGDSNESTEGSLELVEHNSSSEDDSCHVDGNEVTLMEDDIHVEVAGQTLAAHEKSKQVNEKANVDILLVSTSSDGKCYLANTTTGSFCDQIKKSTKSFLYCKAIWVSPTELLGLGYAIFRRRLNDKKFSTSDTVRAYKLEIDKEEMLPIVAQEEVLNFDQAPGTNLLWYISKTRKLICFNTKTRETLLNYDVITTAVAFMCESPQNPIKIALSTATNSICLMNTIDLTSTKISLDYLQARLLSTVKTLAWHENGYYLAYGTVKGQVGLINVDSRTHKTFDIACARTVYSMTWFDDFIFCISGEKLYAYKINSRDTLKLDGFNGYFSFVAAHETFLILGSNRGQIQIYQQKETASNSLSFQLLQNVDVASHYITDIVFEPSGIGKFVVLANEAYVYILHFDAASVTVKLLHKLYCGEPKAQIRKAKWSNRQNNKIVVCGYDGELRIFDLSRPPSQEMIFSLQLHCPLYSAMFLPSDERYILCTGKSITVEIVDTEQPSPEIYLTQSRSLDAIKWATQSIVPTAAGSGGNKRKRNKNLNKTLANTTNSGTSVALTDDLIEKIAEIEIESGQSTQQPSKTNVQMEQKPFSSFLKNPQTALSLITKEQNKNALLKIHDFITLPTFKQKREAVLIARLFGQKIDAEKILAAELANIKSTGSSASEVSALFLNQLNGGLRTQILDAIQTRQLKEWHVSVAPSISYSFWQKCSQAFAEQLLEEGHAMQAACYLLSLHHHHEAIELLASALYFKEAMLIGRVYLDESDPLLDNITDKWIEHLEREGNLHAAALICTVSQQYRRGYEILSKQRVPGPDVAAAIQLLKDRA